MSKTQPVRPSTPLVPPKKNAVRPPPPLDAVGSSEDEHRQFPRARLGVPFFVWIDRGEERVFSATLQSSNLSVSGAFLESSFFMKLGTEVQVRFALQEGDDPVLASARIVREERADRKGEGRTGVGIRFLKFFQQTEVSLAKLFLGEQLQTFAEDYLKSTRARALNNELDRVVDTLAAWELQKVTNPADPWRPGA